MSVRVDYLGRHGFVPLPAILLTWMRFYYGYPVLGVTIGWLKWQLIIKIGVKKVKE